jgi:hypothetical protein
MTRERKDPCPYHSDGKHRIGRPNSFADNKCACQIIWVEKRTTP